MDARIYSGYALCPEQECNTRNGFSHSQTKSGRPDIN